VTAWREPAVRRVRRWVQRHRVLVSSLAAAACIGIVVLAGAAVLLDGARRREAQARQTAEQRTQEAVANLATAEEAVNTFLSKVTEDPALKEHDFHDLRARLLQSAVPLYRPLAESGPAGEDLRPRRAEALGRLGEIYQQIGKHEMAAVHFRDAAGLYGAIAEEATGDVSARHAAALQAMRRAEALYGLARLDEAEGAAHEAAAALQELVSRQPAEPEPRYDLARCYELLGEFCKRTKRSVDAEAHYKEALALADALVKQWPDVNRYQRCAVSCREGLARLYTFNLRSRYRQGVALAREAVRLQEGLLGREPGEAMRRYELAELYEFVGVLHMQANDRQQAALTWTQGLALTQELLRRHPGLPAYLAKRSKFQENLSRCLLYDKQPSRAVEAARDALHGLEQLTDRFPDNPVYRLRLGTVQHHLGEILNARGGAEAALPWYDKAAANHRAFLAVNEDDNTREMLGALEGHRGAALLARKRYDEARQAFEQAVACGGNLVCMYRLGHAQAQAHLGRYAPAVSEVEQVLREQQDNPHTMGAVCAFGAPTYSLAAAAVLKDSTTAESERSRRARAYADEAVRLLRRAKEAGFFRQNQANVKRATSLEALDPLRQREDFRALLKEIGAEGNR
jgi:tetratricopeptide (TPR) repeat protein